MSTVRGQLWGAGDAYERYMGRWSRRVAPLFLDWLAVPAGLRWIDVGCGTGILAGAILARCSPSRVVGIDTSAPFLEAARNTVADARGSFEQGDAAALPFENGVFDVAVSGLVLNFLPDRTAALREMARVVRPGGAVALYVWDYPGHMQVMRYFFDAATALDPRASEFDDGVKAPFCRPGPLADLLREAGLEEVEATGLDIPMPFSDFDDYWTPFLGGTGSAPKYCTSLAEDARETLREIVRKRLPTGPDGEILLAARAWAVKALVRG